MVTREIQDAILAADQHIHKIHGRLLVRPSGTEPIIRIMGEADNIKELEVIVGDLERIFQQNCS